MPGEDLSQNLLWRPLGTWAGNFLCGKPSPQRLPLHSSEPKSPLLRAEPPLCPNCSLFCRKENKIMPLKPTICGFFLWGKGKTGEGWGRKDLCVFRVAHIRESQNWKGSGCSKNKNFLCFLKNPDPWSHINHVSFQFLRHPRSQSADFPSPLLQGPPQLQKQLKFSPSPAQPRAAALVPRSDQGSCCNLHSPNKSNPKVVCFLEMPKCFGTWDLAGKSFLVC